MWPESACHVLISIGTAPTSELRVEQTNVPCLFSVLVTGDSLSSFSVLERLTQKFRIYLRFETLFSKNTSIYTIEFKKSYIILRYKISLLPTRQKELGLIVVKSEGAANKLLSLSSVISLNSLFMETIYRLLVH